MPKTITLNKGNQEEFVKCEDPFVGYFGGVGSGKTYAGLVKGIMMSQQPSTTDTIYGARGLVAAVSYPVLEDVVLTQFFEIIEGTGLLLRFEKAKKKAFLKTPSGKEAEIQFRSLDKPEWMRGRELSWFFIDEGRHVDGNAWRVLVGRLRQPGGYKHRGWVCSTPNGHDWMFDRFHEDSDEHEDGYRWFGAPTWDNAKNLPEEYLQNLVKDFKEGSNYYRQEVLGEFVGVVDGAVYPDWNPVTQVMDPVRYDPDWPLYSFWDFGMGDLGVCVFAQLPKVKRTRQLPLKGSMPVSVELDELRVVGYLASKDWNSWRWADEWSAYCDTYFGGRRPVRNIGDPAGATRQIGSGSSVIQDLTAAGVPMEAAPRRPRDYGLRVMYNMTADNRVWVSKEMATEVGRALSSYKWPVDSSGNKVGSEPIHDWTSHYNDALRYGVTALGDLYADEPAGPEPESPPPDAYDALMESLLEPPAKGYIGHDMPRGTGRLALPPGLVVAR
jgi:hypothetical protein